MKEPIICITGGHLTPALAVIEEIRRQSLPWNIVFIGRSNAFEDGKSPTQEERLVQALSVPFHALTTGRRGHSMVKVPIGFFQALGYLLRYRPKIVLSFGGYIALPVVFAAWMVRIPVITHEQTDDLGLANRIIARFARRVIFSRESGVPIRRGLFDPPKHPTFPIDAGLPFIYITGGSTGAVSLNAFVYPNIEELTRRYCVLHQVGTTSMEEALRAKEGLPKDRRSRYIVASYLDTADISWIYHHALLLIGRSGANTVAEVSAFGLPALFIPLPWAAGDEQSLNASRLEKSGTALVVNQRTLTPASFLAHIVLMLQHINSYRQAARRVAKEYPRSGARYIVDEITRFVHLNLP